MGNKKKEIKIIKKDSNTENYTFVNESILNSIKDKETCSNNK